MNDFKSALHANIQRRIKSLRAGGTVKMGLRNLLQVTPAPSSALPGAPYTIEAYTAMFKSLVGKNSFCDLAN